MRYWWVNQNKTHRHEIGGGYLWSPKRKKNDDRNPFYESMREVAPGDVVLSFVDTRIAALGVVRSYCYECPQPVEFGSAGVSWGAIGWKVEVGFTKLRHRVRPKDIIAQLRELLPRKYAPLRKSGNGLQSVYLAEVSAEFCAVLFRHIGDEANHVRDAARAAGALELVSPAPEPMLEEWEQREEIRIRESATLAETERLSLIQARRGQGIFRQNVRRIEHACRVTRVERVVHLIASHIKPWRDSNNDERLDGENGLLLTPTVDHLFDKGFISFEDQGDLIVSPVADPTSLRRMGVDPDRPPNVGVFSKGQRLFLDYHRGNLLRMSGRA